MKLKKLRITVMLFVIIGMLLLCQKISMAANASISANSTDVSIGTKVTIKVSGSAKAWSLKVSGEGISEKIVGGNLSSKSNQNFSESYSLNTSKVGTYTVTLSGDVTDADGTPKDINSSVTVKVNEKTSSNNNTTNKNTTNKNTTTNQPTKPETPAEPTFKSANETVYATGDINIRKSYSADSNKIGSLKKGESIVRTGIGDNGWSKVTYNGATGYIKTNLLTTEEPAKSSDKALKTLEITPEGLDPEFNPETTAYTLIVGADVEKLDIKAAPNDENAKVEITGNDALVPGDNQVKIVVTAQDETNRIYTINVKKDVSEKIGLTSLKINGYTLSPKFSPTVLEYKINVLDPAITKLDIDATANKEDAKVEITGNTDFKNGENVVEITVTSQDGEEKETYKIYVNKSAMTGTTNNKDNTALFIGIGVVGFVILIIIILIIKNRKKKNNENDDPDDYSDLYGYSSKNSKILENQKNDNIEDYSKKDIENELFGKLPEDVAESNVEEKNEDNFNYNPYVTKDVYGDYNDSKEPSSNDSFESKYNSLFDNSTKNEDFSFRENTTINSIYDNNTSDLGYENKTSNIDDTLNFGFDNNKALIENPEQTEYFNDNDDNDYKPRRSKGKHSK